MSGLGWELVTEIDAENPIEGDLKIVNGRIARLADKRASVAQACTVVLRWWLGEWFLDVGRGMPYLQQILAVPGVSAGTVRAILIRELKKVRHVAGVSRADVATDRTTGLCTVSNVVVDLDDGTQAELAGTFSGRG